MQNNTPEERDCQAPAGKKELPLKEKMEAGLTTSDLNAIIKEVGGKSRLQDCSPKPLPPTDPNSTEANFPNWAKDPFKTKEPPISKVIAACNQPNETPAKAKSIEESRKLLDTFSDKLKNYPKILTYEGSVVLCVAISVNEGNGINLNGLPQVDREVVLSRLPPNASTKLASFEAHLDVEFDDTKDFVLTYQPKDGSPLKFNFFNTVIHPQNLPDTNVPVQQDGGKVMVGSAVVLDQKRIQKLIGIVPQEKSHRDDAEEFPRRQPVANRNAYEIRADVLQMAIDWSVKTDEFRQKKDDDVINLAKKFYEFVEDRRRR